MNFSNKSFLAGLALMPLLGAITVANAGSLMINGTACGTFTNATVSGTGNISLTGVAGCTIGGDTGGGDTGGGDTGGGDTGGGDTGGGDTGGGDTGGGDTGGGDTGGGDTGGGTPTGAVGVVSTPYGPTFIQNLTLGGGIPNTVVSASGISNGSQYDTYSFRFNTGSNTSGLFRTVRYDGSSANRALSISTEPGNMNQMAVGCNLRALRDATLQWSTSSACQLQPNTTYYLNVKATVTCTTNVAACRFTLSGSAQ